MQGGTSGVLLDGVKADNTTIWPPRLMLGPHKLIVSSWRAGPVVIRLMRAGLVPGLWSFSDAETALTG